MDFSLFYHNNFTISAKNKIENKKNFYSTKQPEIVSLIFYRMNLNSTNNTDSINIIKPLNDIKLIRSQRKIDIFQCLKVKNKFYFFRLNFMMKI